MSVATGFTLFDTALGVCGLAWTADEAVAGVLLPEPDAARTQARMRRRHPLADETPIAPPAIEDAIRQIRELLRGEPRDLLAVAVDHDGVPDFHRRVYALVRTIPAGETLTYGEVAARLGEPGAAQAVGQAMGANPTPVIVPCHRVLAANGALGGFSAPGGTATKRRMLVIEGALPEPPPTLFDALVA